MAVILLMLLLASFVSTMDTLFIRSSCSQSETDCKTLSQCLRNITSCFDSNTILNFVEENYDIDLNGTSNFIIVSSVANLTLSGRNVKIHCITRTGFAFINITNLRIQGLRFVNCGKVMNRVMQTRVHLIQMESSNSSFFLNNGVSVAVLFAEVNGVTLEEVGIHHSYGYGVLITNSRWIQISNSNISYSNYRALKCYKGDFLNISCCQDIYAPDRTSSNHCNGGNLVIISTDQLAYTHRTKTMLFHTEITHGINLDTQKKFNENYSYTAGDLSLFISHSLYHETINIEHCNITNNVGHSGGNAIFYVHDNIGSNYLITACYSLKWECCIGSFLKNSTVWWLDNHLRLC